MYTTRVALTARPRSLKLSQSCWSIQLSTSRGLTTSMSSTFISSLALTRLPISRAAPAWRYSLEAGGRANDHDALFFQGIALGRHDVAALPKVNARGHQRVQAPGGSDEHQGHG